MTPALGALAALAIAIASLCAVPAQAQSQSVAGSKPNILLIIGDDVGYGDLGPYLGGGARGMPTPTSTSSPQKG